MITKIFGVSEKIEVQRFLTIFTALISLAPGIFAQITQPSPAAEEDVVKITTTLIQLDVTVTDKSGKIIRDLKPSDFEIYENGEKQDISNFSFISSVKTETDTVKPTPGKTGPPIPPKTLRPEQIRRTIALIVDDLTLSFESVYRVRQALKKYVDEQMRDGDLVAIIRTGGGIGALQQFTTNKQQLYAAIEKVRWNPKGRGRTGAFNALNELPDSITQQDAEDKKAQEDFENAFSDFQEGVFATGTFGALKYIVGGMDQLPGRKSVVLFSDGPSIFTRSESGSFGASRNLEFLRRLVEAANRASVVFYAIDARGVQYTGLTAADKVKPNANVMGQVMSSRGGELFETQQSLAILSNDTGGFPTFNQNDLTGAVRKILEDQSYYLIGYQPDSDTFDPKTRRFNKLEVKVRGDGLQVRYRSGFFNVAEGTVAGNPVAQTQVQQLNSALNSPFAVNDISLRLNAIYGNNAGGNFVTALLHIDTKDLKFTDSPDGSKKAILDILAMTFGDNGIPVDSLAKTFTFDITQKVYSEVLKTGFLCNFTFPVQNPGPYQFRVAVRDAQAETAGSASEFIEVPDLKKDRLTLSGILLENLSQAQLQRFTGDKTAAPAEATDPFTDTSVRRFKRGTVLRYGFEVYNAKPDASGKLYLKTKVRVFKDDKVLTEGQQIPIEYEGQWDLRRVKAGGAIDLPVNMMPGDYILQIIVTDELRKDSRKTISQFVQFEVGE